MSEEAVQTQVAPPADAPTGLMPKLVKPVAPEAPQQAAEPDWYIMEGMPGTGPRPEFLDAKYKTLADQAKSYKELSKKLGKVEDAPDRYDLAKYKDYVNEEDGIVQNVLSFAKEKRLSQDVVDGFIGAFADYVKGARPDYTAEIAKLGDNGRQKVDVVATWAQNNLSDGAIETINRIGHSADVIELLDELRQFQMHQSAQPPAMDGTPAAGFIKYTLKDIQDEINANPQKYLNDPKFRAEMRAKIEQCVGSD